MTILTARFGDGRRTEVEVGERIGSGAVGDVHRLVGRPGWVAKLYRTPADRADYEGKIADMIRDPPDLPHLEEGRREYVQIGWPLAELREPGGGFVGFVMPEIDMSAATELENVLQKASRRVRKLPELYGGRALLAANLAAVMAELHRHGHYFIDMKPINIRFYPDTWYLAILDADGFSVQGTTRWPARQFSEEYIAPEARNRAPEVLGVEQDLFALAVIVFQLLNNGLHPYQGIDERTNLPSTLQERIFAGLYAYGRTPSRDVRPAPATIHDGFEEETRALFDRAFAGDPAGRPTAEEWKRHLQGLITSGVLRKCSRRPDEHMHFSRPCGLCALEARRAAAASAPPPWTPNAPLGAAPGKRPQAPPRARPRGQPRVQPRAQTRPPAKSGRPAVPPGNSATLARAFAGSVANSPRQIPLPPPPESTLRPLIIVGALACLVLAAALLGPRLSKGTAPVAAPPPSRDAAQSPPAAPRAAAPRIDDATLCRSVLSTIATGTPSSADSWETGVPNTAPVAEAQRRGLTPASCATLLRRSAGTAPDSASPPRLEPMSLAEVCRVALAATVTMTSNPAQAAWDDRPFAAAYIQEAQRRGHTPQSCTLALRRPPEDTPASPPPPAAQTTQRSELSVLCRLALDPSANPSRGGPDPRWKDNPAFADYVQQALRRGQTPDSCARLIW